MLGPLGLVKPGAIRWFFVIWMVLALPIGWLMSQLMLAALFYLVLTPAAMVLRLRGRDLLARKKPDTVSFWRPSILLRMCADISDNIEAIFAVSMRRHS